MALAYAAALLSLGISGVAFSQSVSSKPDVLQQEPEISPVAGRKIVEKKSPADSLGKVVGKVIDAKYGDPIP